ncbi:NYN domain-containing protein [Arthrobacter sp. KK5.5]|uniref:NYN domain-containing protein n=1 Tax=Arthrobacter sp. KK5.5 TaxID=3373084 RepID=UPI003EE4EDD7
MASGVPPRRNVAVLVDLENLFGGYGRTVGAVPLGNLVTEVRRVVEHTGVGAGLAVVRAYANWAHPDMNAYQGDIQRHGIEPVQVFSFGARVRNAADIELCVDALAVAHDSPWIDTFVVVTGDGGFIPLVRRLHALGKYVVVVSGGHEDAGISSHMLRSVADDAYEFGPLGLTATPVADRIEAKAPAKKAMTPSVPPKSAAKQAVPAVAGAPTLEAYKETVQSLIGANPALVVDGKVAGSALGSLLRKQWPETTHKDFGSATLGAFLRLHLALEMARPVAGGGKPAGT